MKKAMMFFLNVAILICCIMLITRGLKTEDYHIAIIGFTILIAHYASLIIIISNKENLDV